MGLKLFEGSDSENDDVSRIQIDREYARRYEHNKKREDLHRLQELKKKGLVQPCQSESSSSSSDEDEDGFVILSKKDNEFFEALIKVKKQDPVIKNKDVKLFESDKEEEEEEEDGKDMKSKKKAMYLKDVVAKQLIEEGPEFDDEEREANMEEEKKKSYVEEQEDIRREFLEAAAQEDRGEDLFRIKEKKEEEEGEETGENGDFVRKLDEYFGGDGEVDEGNKFLKEFFRNRMWVDREMEGGEIGEEELERVSEDEREIERQEEYEYRFQENAGDRVVGHARKVEGSVRKKANSRKEQRKSKEERMEAARIEREEELKHLKNLKKEEMDEKVRKILRTAGIREDEVVPLSRKELEEEFDPEEYDRMMKAAFGEEYYEEEDADPEYGSKRDEDEGEIEKPDFDEEDELLGLPKGWDECGPGDGFLAARERSLKRKVGNEGESDQEEEEEEEEEDAEKGKRKRKRKKSAILEKAKEAMMEEYYRLDYEDTIGDLKTRFKYAKTKPNRYGLSAEELLVMDEKELNQFVSLKKLAPYREKEWKLSNEKRFQLKMRTKELLRGGKLDEQKGGKKKRSRDNAEKSISLGSAVEDGKAQFQESNGDLSSLSRQAKRRRRQAEVKLSHSRLMAYGKIPSKSKRKAKH
ncbi:hypothetical protein F2P56_024530 [Juglans regia]|uniref:Protein KRI1 homolog n=2 Tax=Juglans regia TaxID=51240 RepID=A0A2I4DNH1_JUGRE|nr:protein KRI1 homolog [Juglans regia]XP_035538711.1 protein KRI1 homolog [Juglans regia]KAF5454899.1 hypothetical protein F2P56_024530 [Juglans regia]